MRLKHKLTLANMLFKLLFVIIFLAATPYLSERINLLQTDNELIDKREMVIDLISEYGTSSFLTHHTDDVFGSYNILKEEFISLEQIDLEDHWNFIEVTERLIENEIIEYRVLNYSFLVDGEVYLLEIGKSLSSIAVTEQNIRKITLLFLVSFVLISVLFEFTYTSFLLKPLSFITGKLSKTSTPELYDKSGIATSTEDFKSLDKTLTSLMEKMNDLLQKEKEITQNISHELLTPVSILRSKLENLLMQENISDEAAIKIEEALTSLHRLKGMVNSLLLIARIESKQYLKQDTFLLNDLMQEIIEELQPLAEDKEITIHFETGDNFRFINANRALMFSMFYNVINNAIKHIDRSCQIKISTFQNETGQQVIIADNGQGIPQEMQQNLFLRFKKKKTTEDENTGIGLAIAKSIADFHSIEIKIDSELKKGTQFKFAWDK